MGYERELQKLLDRIGIDVCEIGDGDDKRTNARRKYFRKKSEVVGALCFSEICFPDVKLLRGCPKAVPKTTFYCPDCGHALFWKKKGHL